MVNKPLDKALVLAGVTLEGGRLTCHYLSFQVSGVHTVYLIRRYVEKRNDLEDVFTERFQGIEDLEFIRPEMILVELVTAKWNIPIQ